MKTQFPPPFPEDEQQPPSHKPNIWSSIFPVHPIASTAPLPVTLPFFDDGCIICQEKYNDTPGFHIAHLYCDHMFHLSCIRNSWDQGHLLTWSCPLCRLSHPRTTTSLANLVGITPEVWDNQDYRAEMGADYVAAHPDVSSTFMGRDQRCIELSKEWTWLKNGRRHRGVEMARVRRRRAALVESINKQSAERKHWIWGMDPQPAA